MNSVGLKDLTQVTRESGMKASEQALKGVSVTPAFAEGFEDKSFSELEDEVTAKDNAASTDLLNARKRMELIYAMAMFRDAKYTHAGRKFMMALGANSEFRLLYEGQKIHSDALNKR